MRQIRIEGDAAYIPLTQGYEAVVDAEDAPLVAEYLWLARPSLKKDGTVRTVYVGRKAGPRKGNRTIHLHRVVMNAPDGIEVDHIDGNGLNNRRSNLRLATRSENGRNVKVPLHNTSGQKGVRWNARENRWHAFIKVNGEQKWLGSHKCKTSATFAYVIASHELHREFGRP